MNLPCFFGSTHGRRCQGEAVDGMVACGWVDAQDTRAGDVVGAGLCGRCGGVRVGARARVGAWRGAAALGHVVLGRQPEREDEELEEEDVGEVQDELDGHRVARVVDYTRGATRLNYTVLLRVLDCGEERRARRARVRARAAVYSQWGSWAAGQRSLSTGMDRPLLGSSPPPLPDLPKKALEGLRLRTG